MKPNVRAKAKTETADASKRIGAGKGIITDPEDFDKWDAESRRDVPGR